MNRFAQGCGIEPDELIVDFFAGGGGASQGIARALGRPVDVAINHDADAIAMHEANHPSTRHFLEDVWKVTPREVTQGRRVGLAWFSPDCKHFSRAKGSKPVEKSIRSLAWVAVRFAAQKPKRCRPRVIVIENVREFEDWGPLVPAWSCAGCGWKGTEGQAKLLRRRAACPRCESVRIKQTAEQLPDPKRKGLTFRRFVGMLRGLGYDVAWKVLNAADFGAPTHRRRLFVVARNDGEDIVWPDPTHGDPKKIGSDLSSEDLKPWRTAAECIDWSIPCPSIFDRKTPLKEKTLRRIALGIKRYVIDNPKPFIVGVGGRAGQSPSTSVDAPLGTITAKNDRAVVVPVIARIGQTGGNGKYTNGADEPLTTITTKAEHLLVAPVIAHLAHGDGQTGKWKDSVRAGSIEAPLGTIHSGGKNYALVAAFLAKHFGGMVGVPLDTPLPTTTARGTQNQIVAANLIHLNHGEKQWSGCDEPMRTVTTGNHAGLVYSFLVKYFGSGESIVGIDQPLPTITTKDRFGLVVVMIGGEPYVIVDIGMRMLTPDELSLAQGFGANYIRTGTKTSQVARIGNSVPPPLAKSVVKANCTRRVLVAV